MRLQNQTDRYNKPDTNSEMFLHLPALSDLQAEGWNVTSLSSPQQPPQSVHMLPLQQPVLLCFPGSGQEVSLKRNPTGLHKSPYMRGRTWRECNTA